MKAKLIVLGIVLVVSIVLRLWNFNSMGRTWDEIAYVDTGQKYIEYIKKFDFTNSFWIKYPDILPLPRYIYGFAGQWDVKKFSFDALSVYHYDLTYSRLTGMIFSVLTILLVTLIGYEYISPFVGLSSGLILAFLPYYLGLSQIVSIENIQFFFFTASVYSFLKLFNKITIKKCIGVGVLLGFSLQAKYTNVLLLPLFFLLYGYYVLNKDMHVTIYNLVWTRFDNITVGLNKKKLYKFFTLLLNKKFVILFTSALLGFFLLWPMPYFHLSDIWRNIYSQRFQANVRPPPELFFGRFMEVPVFYYIVYFFITTPLLVLVLFFSGILSLNKRNGYIWGVLLLWFSFPFIQSFYSFRQNGIRYIIEVYAPLSLLAGMGLAYIIQLITQRKVIQYTSLFITVLYLLLTLSRITPYYLNYFNETVGGIQHVYKVRLFPIGWWGDGMKDAARYLSHKASKGSSIGLEINPMHTFLVDNKFHYEHYDPSKKYNYVVVNDYAITRQFFNESSLYATYKKIYSVVVDSVPLVTVYTLK